MQNELKIAPLWRRLAAMVYDSFILVALSMAYGALVIAMVAIVGSAPIPENYERPLAFGPLFQFGWLLVIGGFFIFFWHRAGQTIGMRTWRLQLAPLVEGDEPLIQSSIPYSTCLIRIVCASLSLSLLGLGYLWCWFDADGHTLHDRLSKTQVLVTPKRKG